jgi:hypothetical protein
MFVLLYLAMMSNAQAQEPQRESLRNLKVSGPRTARSVMDKDLLGVYARIMQYQESGQEMKDAKTSKKSTLKDRLTITVSEMRSGEPGELAQYMDQVMAERSEEVLNIEREEMCRILESCDLIFTAAWVKASGKSTLIKSLSLNDADHYTAYMVTVSYKGTSRSHKGLILYYNKSGKRPQIVDGLIPSINRIAQDRMAQAKTPWSQYVESRRNGRTSSPNPQINRPIINPYCRSCHIEITPDYAAFGGPVQAIAYVKDTEGNLMYGGVYSMSFGGHTSNTNSVTFTPTSAGYYPASVSVVGLTNCIGQQATGSKQIGVLQINTETVATTPANRSRTTIGIGEEVNISIVPSTVSVSWSATGGGNVSPGTGNSATFTASKNPTTSVIHAQIAGADITVPFNVVAPNGMRTSLAGDGSLGSSGTNNIGANSRFDCYVLPDYVSFYNIEFQENIPGEAFTWPDGTAGSRPPAIVPWSVGFDNRTSDNVSSGLNPAARIFDGTNYVNFEYGVRVPEEYKNEAGNWIPFLSNENHPRNYRGADLQARTKLEASNTAIGGWMGPWQ